MSFNQGNPLYRRNAAGAKLNEGKIRRQLGDTDEALRLAGEAIRMQKEIAAADRENQEIKLDLKESYEDLALAHIESGDFASALENARRAAQTNDLLLERDNENYEFWVARLRLERDIGDAFLRQGEKNLARRFYRNAVEIADRRVPEKLRPSFVAFRTEVAANLKKSEL